MYKPLDRIPGLEWFTTGSGKYEIRNLEGPINIQCWSGFQSRQEAYNAPESPHPSDGTARITIGGDMVMDDYGVQPYHINAYNHLMEFQEQVQQNILDTLFSQYQGLQEMYGYDPEDAAAIMPDVQDPTQFKKLIGLSAVHLLNVSKDDMAYVGYEFGCTWDDEHGLGVMTHNGRIIELGDASTAFLSWIADRDRDPDGNSDSVFDALQAEPVSVPLKKPWWKFW